MLDRLPGGLYNESSFLSLEGCIVVITDNKKQRVRKIAIERIEILVASALREKQDPALASRQADLAKKIAMRHRVRMPYEIRQLYCRKCKSFIVPGRTARIRLGRLSSGTQKAVHITCILCGHTYHKIIVDKRNKDL